MGGNALKAYDIETVRLGPEEYAAVQSHVVWVLQGMTAVSNVLDELDVAAIPSYKDKADHGDLDVLVQDNCLDYPEKLELLLKHEFGATVVHKNGPVWSFDYNLLCNEGESFQVDLIMVDGESFDFALNYFSYNDLGNLIGRVAHRLGFKFGHEGLFYVYRDGSSYSKDILMTRNFAHAIEYLGFSYARYEQGFDSLESIFDYVSSSEFFCKSMYDLELRSYAAKVRDRKRVTYTTFLAWLKDRDYLCEDLDASEDDWLDDALRTFPEFAETYLATAKEVLVRKLLKEKFNGEVVKNVTGLEGVELGDFIKSYRNDHGGSVLFDIFVLETNPDDIAADLAGYYDVRREEVYESSGVAKAS